VFLEKYINPGVLKVAYDNDNKTLEDLKILIRLSKVNKK
jgi:hypothetical protein